MLSDNHRVNPYEAPESAFLDQQAEAAGPSADDYDEIVHRGHKVAAIFMCLNVAISLSSVFLLHDYDLFSFSLFIDSGLAVFIFRGEINAVRWAKVRVLVGMIFNFGMAVSMADVYSGIAGFVYCGCLAVMLFGKPHVWKLAIVGFFLGSIFGFMAIVIVGVASGRFT